MRAAQYVALSAEYVDWLGARLMLVRVRVRVRVRAIYFMRSSRKKTTGHYP